MIYLGDFMIRLNNYVLDNIDISNIRDNEFSEKMKQDGDFKRFFGGVVLKEGNQDSIFMNDYLLKSNGHNVGYIHIGDKVIRDDVVAVTLYYYIDKMYRGNGIATGALRELMEYLINQEYINYFILNIHRENMASIKVAINNGFIRQNEIDDDEEEIQFVHKTL